jgi:hypothetical protein
MAVAQPMPASTDNTPPAVSIGGPSPVKAIDGNTLRMLGQELNKLFSQYASDRQLTELRSIIRNLRQYLGIYDPEIESRAWRRSAARAYPRLTRVKCISMLARLMNLMFPGNERQLGARRQSRRRK